MVPPARPVAAQPGEQHRTGRHRALQETAGCAVGPALDPRRGPSTLATEVAMNPRYAPWVALLLFLVQAPVYADYVTDDSYIYARFADNLARLGELSFNPGEPVHAATSPLWAGLGADRKS